MKKYFLALFSLLFVFHSQNFAQNFLWGASEGGPDYLEFGLCVDVDEFGNVYMIGEFYNGAIIGGSTYFTAGNNDQMIVKYDPYGNFEWVRLFGSASPDRGYTINAGVDRHLYVAGYGKYAPGWKTTQTTLHARDATMMRLQPDGTIDWMHAVDGDVYSEATDVESDANGNSYFTGLIRTQGYFGTDTLIGNGAADGYICAFDSLGNTTLLKSFGSTDEDHPMGIGRDAAGNIYVGGYYGAGFTFGPSILPNAAGSDGFVLKYSPSGVPLWAKALYGPGNAQVDAIAVSPSGEVSVACRFADTLYVSGNTLIPDADDICIVQYDSLGNLRWIKHTPTPSLQFTEDIERDADGNLYVCGFYYGGFAYDTTTALNGGIEDAFLMKLDPSGHLLHLKTLSGPDSEFIFDLALDKANNVYTTGSYIGTIPLGPDTFTSVNSTHDVFTAKYGMPASIVLDSLSATPYCANEPFEVYFTVFGGYDSLNTFTAQLSDASGSFASPQVLGTTRALFQGTIQAAIPGVISPGVGYRIRVVSDMPAAVSNDNGIDIVLVANGAAPVTISGDTVFCAGDTVLLTATPGFASYLWSTGDTTPSIEVTVPGNYTVTITDTTGCRNSDSHLLSVCVSLNEGLSKANIRVYPNPAQDRLVIDYGNQGPPCEFTRLWSTEGKLMRETLFCPDSATSFEFMLEGIPNGLYFIQIPVDTGFITSKIVIRR